MLADDLAGYPMAERQAVGNYLCAESAMMLFGGSSQPGCERTDYGKPRERFASKPCNKYVVIAPCLQLAQGTVHHTVLVLWTQSGARVNLSAVVAAQLALSGRLNDNV